MKGANWGRIVARVLSVVLVMKVVAFLASTVPNSPWDVDLSLGGSEYLIYMAIELVGLVALAMLLWFGCDRFSPSKEDLTTENKDSLAFTTVAIAAIGTYFFLQQGGSALAGGLDYAFEQDIYKWVPKRPAFAFHLAAVALSAVLVIKSKAFAAWIAK